MAALCENELAKKLIKAAGVSIAAPSANQFDHVSPAACEHVYDNLKHYDLLILEESQPSQIGNDDKKGVEGKVGCEVGIESTVIKINHVGGVI